jgi:hypothetical protein
MFEDPGIKVFKPVGFKPFIATFAEKYQPVADDSKEIKKKSSTDSAAEELQQ